MRKIIYILFFVFVTFSTTLAQEIEDNPILITSREDNIRFENLNCPKITFKNPDETFQIGEVAIYSVEISTNIDQTKIKYKWEVNNATVIDGQGTRTLSIATTVNTKQNLSKVKLQIEGFDDRCNLSFTTELGKPLALGKARLVEEIKGLKNEDIRSKLDVFFRELMKEPDATGYLINYGPSTEVALREKMIRNQITYRNYEASQIVFVHGGIEKEIRTRLWLVPKGADPLVIH